MPFSAPWQYRAVVHWIRGPSSVSESTQITLLLLLFELSSCAWLTRAMLLVWDNARHGISTPFLKMLFFCSDSRFVIRAIYLPSLFQPLPRWWTITRGETYKIWLDNYILSANTVGFIYVTYPPSMNPVGAVLSWTAWDGNSEHPAGGGLHGGATPAGCSVFIYLFPLDSHQILENVMIFRSWPLPHKLCIVNHQGWSSLLHLFKLKR